MTDLIQPDPLDLVMAEMKRVRQLLTVQTRLLETQSLTSEEAKKLAEESTAALDRIERDVHQIRENHNHG
jgi:hypothetical protein